VTFWTSGVGSRPLGGSTTRRPFACAFHRDEGSVVGAGNVGLGSTLAAHQGGSPATQFRARGVGGEFPVRKFE
jgi:hypothetical protein